MGAPAMPLLTLSPPTRSFARRFAAAAMLAIMGVIDACAAMIPMRVDAGAAMISMHINAHRRGRMRFAPTRRALVDGHCAYGAGECNSPLRDDPDVSNVSNAGNAAASIGNAIAATRR
jgi:hypothetical protein